MNAHTQSSNKRGEILSITNKTLILSVDRLSLFVLSGELTKARSEIKSIKEQVADAERLLTELEKIQD